MATCSFGAVTLSDAYRSALEKTEVSALGRARINQFDAKTDQARANFLPQFSFGANYSRQDLPANPSQSYTKLNLSQSLYSGGRDQASLASSKFLKIAHEQEYSNAKLNTFVSVARSYYQSQSAEWEVKTIRKTSDLANDRLKEIKKRTEIGKSRKIELLAAQAQLSVLESQLKAAEGNLATVKDQFTLITGLDKDVVLAEQAETVKMPESIDKYLPFLEKRPDIQSMKSQIDAAESSIGTVKSGHLPALSADGNYYLSRSSSVASTKENKWDVGLTLTLPLYSGGVTSARVQEYSEKQREIELLLSQARRQAESGIRTAHNNLMSALNQMKSLEAALAATEQNFKEQEKNYRYGQATNLDVIQALNLYLDTKRTLDRTRFQGMTSWAELDAATAQIPEAQ